MVRGYGSPPSNLGLSSKAALRSEVRAAARRRRGPSWRSPQCNRPYGSGQHRGASRSTELGRLMRRACRQTSPPQRNSAKLRPGVLTCCENYSCEPVQRGDWVGRGESRAVMRPATRTRLLCPANSTAACRESLGDHRISPARACVAPSNTQALPVLNPEANPSMPGREEGFGRISIDCHASRTRSSASMMPPMRRNVALPQICGVPSFVEPSQQRQPSARRIVLNDSEFDQCELRRWILQITKASLRSLQSDRVQIMLLSIYAWCQYRAGGQTTRRHRIERRLVTALGPGHFEQECRRQVRGQLIGSGMHQTRIAA